MNLKLAAFTLSFAMLMFCDLAAAQPAERMSRPFQESTTGPDGRLQVSRDATMGNLVVDQYSRIGALLFAPGANLEAVAEGARPLMCDLGGSAGIAAVSLRRLINRMDADERMRLRSRDAASLTELSIALAADLDGVRAEAIRTDEAHGPGVYHNAINGFRVALDVCRFFGHERRL